LRKRSNDPPLSFGLTRRLARFPELGRPGRVRGTLELPVKDTKFIIAYGLSADHLTVYAVALGQKLRAPAAIAA
jgi:hypothetical protein